MSLRRPIVYVLVPAILLLAGFFYLGDIARVSFWEDESWMAVADEGSFPQVWAFAAEQGVHPPLYFYLGWFYVRTAGNSELALRWLAGLCALPGIALAYRLGADWYGRRTGVFAALLTTGSLFLIYFGRLARHYTLFFTLALALVWVYDLWVRSAKRSAVSGQQSAKDKGSGSEDVNRAFVGATHASPLQKAALVANISPDKSVAATGRHFGSINRWLVAIALLQAALLYTHYFGVWMAVVVGLHALMTLRGRNRLLVIGALAVGGLLFVPWIPSVLYQLGHAKSGLGYATDNPVHALTAYLDRVLNGDYRLGLILAAAGVVAVWRWRKPSLSRRVAFSQTDARNHVPTQPPRRDAILGVRLPAVQINGREKSRPYTSTHPGLMLALWLIVPLALSLAVNARFRWFIERNMIFTLGGAYILFGAGLAYLSQWRVGRWAAVSAAAVFVILGLTRYDDFWPYVTPYWRDLVNEIALDARPTDVFMVSGETYSLTYYLHRLVDPSIHVMGLSEWQDDNNKPERVWLTGSQGAVRTEAIDSLPSHMQQTRRYALGVLVTEFYQRSPGQPVTTFGGQIALAVRRSPLDLTVAPGQKLYLDLWWRAVRTPDFDYSAGVYLVAADGALLAQQNGGFDRGQVSALALPSDSWTPDGRTLDIPPDAAPGDYTLLTSVYDWRDSSRLVPENGRDDRLFVLGTVHVGERSPAG